MVNSQPLYEPDRHLFGNLVLTQLRAALPGRTMRYRRGTFRIDIQGLSDGIALFDLYATYCFAGADRQGAVIEDWIKRKFSAANADPGPVAREPIPIGTLAEESAHLLPRIMTRFEAESAVLRTRVCGPEPRFSWTAVAGGLAAMVVVSRPDVFVHLRDGDLASWGISFEDALAIAIKNFTAAGRFLWGMTPRGLFVYEGDCAAAWLLIPEMLRALPTKGDTVVCVPRRDLAIVAGSDDPGALRAFEERAHQEWMAGPHSLSPRPLRVGTASIDPYLPPEGHASRAKFEYLSRVAAGRDYEAQRNVLLGGSGPYPSKWAPFPAEVLGGRSFTVLTRGVPTLLPEVDLVILQEPVGPRSNAPRYYVFGAVEFSRLRAAMGPRIERQGSYPERWFVPEFPSAEEIRMMEPSPVPMAPTGSLAGPGCVGGGK